MEEQAGLSNADLVRWALGAATPDERKAAFGAIADRHHLAVFRQCARWFPYPEQAQDVCQAAFEAACTLLADGNGPKWPEQLAGWLIEIARRRGLEYRRGDRPAGVSWAIPPEGQSLEQTEDDEGPRSAGAVHRTHLTRLVDAVVATLTARQQRVYQLRMAQERTGAEVAERIGTSDESLSDEITHVQDLIATGFGALMLFEEAHRPCADLALVIGTAAGGVGPVAFSAALRKQIVRHFDDCSVCNDRRRELVGAYAPALIPALFAADLHDRLTEVIDGITRRGAAQDEPEAAEAAGAESPGADRLQATGRGGGLRSRVRRHPVRSAAIAAFVLALVGGGVAALTAGGGQGPGTAALTSKGHGVAAAASKGRASSTCPAPTPPHTTAPRRQSGVIAVDYSGVPLPAATLAFARKVLADARSQNCAALDRLADPANPDGAAAVALNKILARPGTYQMIITVLTETHGASQDGGTAWPGFILAGTNEPITKADARKLGVQSANGYRGIEISIGDAYDAEPNAPAQLNISPPE